ncbi:PLASMODESMATA CALLOSE-BINDING PROTEIN 5 isoform X1 [Populus trichocarpa]|uniref:PLASMODESMATA CALLOSE-BINDING PROTEIN 5 isoform X1 n=1 Tax=Populus trichocarpa TaxID=3694 RepID=UPI002278277F|nr:PLASMODESMATA CALLOSE-BINDING PROTEIN 5 isoform X1 [Populus trichocarpa]
MSKLCSFSMFVLVLLVALSLPKCLMGQRGVAPRDLWCVAKNNAADQALQEAINWACGQGGANCGPIQQGGACYDSNDMQRTASWAFNDYYLKNGLTDDACYFSNTAALTSLNPSNWILYIFELNIILGFDKCKFPSSLSVNNGSIYASTGTIQMGPDNADLSSSSNRVGGTWFLPLFTSYLFVVFTWLIH